MLWHSDSILYYYCYYYLATGRMVDQTGLLAQKTENTVCGRMEVSDSRLWHLSFLWLHLDFQSSIEHEDIEINSGEVDSMVIGCLKVCWTNLPMYVCSSVMTWQLCPRQKASDRTRSLVQAQSTECLSHSQFPQSNKVRSTSSLGLIQLLFLSSITSQALYRG
jgi:hypothetical protein